MASVTFDKATCVYDDAGDPAVDALDLHVQDGEFLVLVGPSGCGKSTSLRMLAGLEEVTSGAVFIGDDDVTDAGSADRDVAMVFQNYALYPHWTVAKNMAFSLKMRKISKEEINRRVDEAARLLDLTELLDRKPKALSGGQQQRVAMGRAIVREPHVFLMDEPLSNLDAKLRVQTRSQIAALQARLGTTTVYVTHDQTEAMTMGHRVAVLRDGLLQQVDTPRALYDSPGNAFVASFIGSPAMNLRTVPFDDDGAHLGPLTIPLTSEQRAAAAEGGASTVTVGFRPEAVDVVSEGDGALSCRVVLVESLGADAYVYGTTQADGTGIDEEDQRLAVRVEGSVSPALGETVHLAPHVEKAHLFHATTGTRIP